MTRWDVEDALRASGEGNDDAIVWLQELVALGNEMRSMLEDDERSDEPAIVVQWLQHIDGKDWR